MRRGIRSGRGARRERQRHHSAGDPHRAPERQPVRAHVVFAARQTPQALMPPSAPLVPAQAGTQSKKVDSRFRGNERVKEFLAGSIVSIAFAIALPVAAKAGDFGRPKPSLLDGLIPQQYWTLPVTGYSDYPLTDLEVELRDRSYVLIRIEIGRAHV